MRALIMLVAGGSLLAACGSKNDEVENHAAAAQYAPPTVTSRLDFGGEIERRFHRIDVNRDDRIAPDELPDRWQSLVKRGDKNGDGALSAQEWSELMLSWFDRNDLNGDGTLTSEERETYRERRQAARARQPDAAAR